MPFKYRKFKNYRKINNLTDADFNGLPLLVNLNVDKKDTVASLLGL